MTSRAQPVSSHLEDPGRGEITRWLHGWAAGDAEATERLLDEVYSQLRRLANHLLHNQAGQLTLQPTELVHEAYLRLAGQKRVVWKNRQQFFAVAGQILRRLIVDQLRFRARDKRGGGAEKVAIAEVTLSVEGIDLDLLALDEALSRLEAIDSQAAKVVELRYFAGLDHDEVAAALGIGRATVGRAWRFARAWLKGQLSGGAVVEAAHGGSCGGD